MPAPTWASNLWMMEPGSKPCEGSSNACVMKAGKPSQGCRLEDTFADASIEDNWESLFRTMALFRRVAQEVGAGLGYAYPRELDQRVTEFVKKMQAGMF